MKIEGTLSEQLRDFLKLHTSKHDLEVVAAGHGVSYFTLRNIIYLSQGVSDKTRGAVIELIGRAGQNRKGYITKKTQQIERKKLEIKSLTKDIEKSDSLWELNKQL